MRDEESDPIPAACHQAIRQAAGFLLDDVLRKSWGDAEESIALDELPPLYRARIDKDLPRWCVAFAAMASKLAEPETIPASCVAEQLAMHTILTYATEILLDGVDFGNPESIDREQAEDWMQRVIDATCADQDYLFLYDPALDGIGAHPAEPIGQFLRTVNLAYEDWFRPLPGMLGHPYFDGIDLEDDEGDCPWF